MQLFLASAQIPTGQLRGEHASISLMELINMHTLTQQDRGAGQRALGNSKKVEDTQLTEPAKQAFQEGFQKGFRH